MRCSISFTTFRLPSSSLVSTAFIIVSSSVFVCIAIFSCLIFCLHLNPNPQILANIARLVFRPSQISANTVAVTARATMAVTAPLSLRLWLSVYHSVFLLLIPPSLVSEKKKDGGLNRTEASEIVAHLKSGLARFSLARHARPTLTTLLERMLAWKLQFLKSLLFL